MIGGRKNGKTEAAMYEATMKQMHDMMLMPPEYHQAQMEMAMATSQLSAHSTYLGMAELHRIERDRKAAVRQKQIEDHINAQIEQLAQVEWGTLMFDEAAVQQPSPFGPLDMITVSAPSRPAVKEAPDVAEAGKRRVRTA